MGANSGRCGPRRGVDRRTERGQRCGWGDEVDMVGAAQRGDGLGALEADGGGGVVDEFARGTASGRGGSSAGTDRGQAIAGGAYPNRPPRTRFLLICACVGRLRLSRKI